MHNKYISLLSFLVLSLSITAQPLLDYINPTSFPFPAQHGYVFDDGSAYIPGYRTPFLMKFDDIINPDSSSIEIVSLGFLNLYSVDCLDKQTCIGFTNFPGTNPSNTSNYITNDGGNTWTFYHLKDAEKVYFISDSLWIAQGVNGIQVSDDIGNNWTNFGYTDLRYSYNDNNTPIFISQSNNKIYTINGSGVYELANLGSLISNPGMSKAFYPTSSGFIYISDSGKVYSINQSFTIANLLYDLNDNVIYSHKKGDTIVTYGLSTSLISADDGINWQLNTLNKDPFQQPGIEFVANHLGYSDAKLIFGGIGNGVLSQYDFLTNSYAHSPGNTHPSTGIVYSLHNGTFFAPSKDARTDSTLKGYVIGADGTIVASDRNTPSTGFQLKVDFADNLSGTGFSGELMDNSIYTTADGGYTWLEEDMVNIIGSPVLRIVSIDYAEDASSIVIHYLDPIYQMKACRIDPAYNLIGTIPVTSPQFFSDYLDSDTGIYIENSKVLSYTTDGGLTRTSILNLGTVSSILYYRRDGRTMLVYATDGLYYFDDLDGPYQKYSFGTTPLSKFRFLATREFEILKFNNADHILYYSPDTGKSFNNAQIPIGDIDQIIKTDSTTILLVGNGGQIYRLRQFQQISFNQEEHPTDNAIAFYPNPADQQLNFDFTDNRKRHIQIYDLSGNLVLEIISHDKSISIALSQLPSAMYICNVVGPDGSKSFRFVKL